MIISGNGLELTVESIGKNVKVEASAEFDRKDLSGQNSSSEVSAAGNKPKRIRVSMMVEKKKADNITTLLKMAEAFDSDGNPIIYTISSKISRVMQIRQAIFDGDVRVRESEGLLSFDVHFELKEMSSPAEKKEERERSKASEKVETADGEVQVGSANHEKVVEAAST